MVHSIMMHSWFFRWGPLVLIFGCVINSVCCVLYHTHVSVDVNTTQFSSDKWTTNIPPTYNINFDQRHSRNTTYTPLIISKMCIEVKIIRYGMRQNRFNACSIAKKKRHSILHGEGAYLSKTFIWEELCSSGFPPHPGPTEHTTGDSNPNTQNHTVNNMNVISHVHTQPTMTFDPLSNLQFHSNINVGNVLNAWQVTTTMLIHEMRICALCGLSWFGGCQGVHKICRKNADYPLAYIDENPHLANYTSNGHVYDDGTLDVSLCKDCVANPSKWACFLSSGMRGNGLYQKIVCTAPDPLFVQTLSLVDVSLNFVKTYMGYAKCHLTNAPILHGALVRWYQCENDNNDSNFLYYQENLKDVLQHNLECNPLYQNYKCVLECGNINNQELPVALPILPASTIMNITQTHIDNAPTLWDEGMNGERPYQLSTVVPAEITFMHKNPLEKFFHVGTCQSRHHHNVDIDLHCNDLSTQRLHCTTSSNNNSEDRSAHTVTPPPTLEAALFPFLFPEGNGYFQNGPKKDFHQYLKHRMQCWFSIYTLYTPYVLLMYQIKQSILLLNAVSQVSLERDIASYRRRTNGATLEDALQNVAKYAIPKSIPNSPAYHRAQLKNLLAMVDCYGLPNFFVTLTADEVSELRWPEYIDIEEDLREYFGDRNLDWKSAPVECMRLFHKRVEIFMKKYILCNNGILGPVLHYLIRYEFQDRGSPHVHIILWIDPTHEDILTQEIIAYVPAEFDPCSNEYVRPSNVAAQKLYDIVIRKQMHRCHVHGRGCRKSGGNCQKGFPYPPNNDGSKLDISTNKWIYARPFVGQQNGDSMNRNVVPYHPILALLWNAHSNILRITAEAWSFYVLKYATKMEPCGFLDLDIQIAKQLHFTDSVSENQLKLITGLVLQRPISPTEAAFNSLQMPVIQFSDTCHFIGSAPPELRSRIVTKANGVCIPHVDIYCARPECMQHLTFYDFFKTIIYRDKPLQGKTLRAITTLGHYLYDAPDGYLVRFTDYHPAHQTEAYAYNVLLRKIAFSHESQLLSIDNLSQSYTKELVLQGILVDESSIDQLADDYASYHLYTIEARRSLHEALSVGLETADVMGGITNDDENNSANQDISTIQTNLDSILLESSSYGIQAPSTIYTEIPQTNNLETNNTDMTPNTSLNRISHPELTESQKVVAECLLHPDCKGTHALTGVPGAGKTFLMKFLINKYQRQYGEDAVLLAATTGVAAIRLHQNARTVHSTFYLQSNRKFLPPFVATDERFANIKKARIIIIDECSMLTAKTMSHVVYRISQACGTTDTSCLNDKLLLLVGDFYQLPPVCKHRLESENDVCTICHLTQWTLWPEVKVHHLQASFRHATDPIFAQFLNEIRTQKVPQQVINETLSNTYINESDVSSFIGPHTTVLCSHIKQVDHYNQLALQTLFPADSIKEVQVIVTNPPLIAELNDSEKKWYESWVKDVHFHRLPLITKNAMVMVTENNNKDLSKGANGDVGEVIDWEHDLSGNVKKITIKLRRNNNIVSFRPTLVETEFRFNMTLRKRTFPLTLAYAMTAHKSQGATLGSTTIIHITSAFAAGLLYVMLSRVTNREFLKIVGSLRPDDIKPMPDYITNRL